MVVFCSICASYMNMFPVIAGRPRWCSGLSVHHTWACFPSLQVVHGGVLFYLSIIHEHVPRHCRSSTVVFCSICASYMNMFPIIAGRPWWCSVLSVHYTWACFPSLQVVYGGVLFYLCIIHEHVSHHCRSSMVVFCSICASYMNMFPIIAGRPWWCPVLSVHHTWTCFPSLQVVHGGVLFYLCIIHEHVSHHCRSSMVVFCSICVSYMSMFPIIAGRSRWCFVLYVHHTWACFPSLQVVHGGVLFYMCIIHEHVSHHYRSSTVVFCSICASYMSMFPIIAGRPRWCSVLYVHHTWACFPSLQVVHGGALFYLCIIHEHVSHHCRSSMVVVFCSICASYMNMFPVIAGRPRWCSVLSVHHTWTCFPSLQVVHGGVLFYLCMIHEHVSRHCRLSTVVFCSICASYMSMFPIIAVRPWWCSVLSVHHTWTCFPSLQVVHGGVLFYLCILHEHVSHHCRSSMVVFCSICALYMSMFPIIAGRPWWCSVLSVHHTWACFPSLQVVHGGVLFYMCIIHEHVSRHCRSSMVVFCSICASYMNMFPIIAGRPRWCSVLSVHHTWTCFPSLQVVHGVVLFYMCIIHEHVSHHCRSSMVVFCSICASYMSMFPIIAGRPRWCSVLYVHHTWACSPSLQVVHGGVLFYLCIIHEHVSNHCRSSMVVFCSISASYMSMFPIIAGRLRWCSVLSVHHTWTCFPSLQVVYGGVLFYLCIIHEHVSHHCRSSTVVFSSICASYMSMFPIIAGRPRWCSVLYMHHIWACFPSLQVVHGGVLFYLCIILEHVSHHCRSSMLVFCSISASYMSMFPIIAGRPRWCSVLSVHHTWACFQSLQVVHGGVLFYKCIIHEHVSHHCRSSMVVFCSICASYMSIFTIIAGRPWWCSVLSVHHTWTCFPSLQVVHGGVLFYLCIIHEHVPRHCRSSRVVFCSICALYMSMFPIIAGRPWLCSVLYVHHTWTCFPSLQVVHGGVLFYLCIIHEHVPRHCRSSSVVFCSICASYMNMFPIIAGRPWWCSVLSMHHTWACFPSLQVVHGGVLFYLCIIHEHVSHHCRSSTVVFCSICASYMSMFPIIAGRPWLCSVLYVHHTWTCFPSLQVVHGGVLFYLCIIHEHVSHHYRSSTVVFCSICASYMNMFPIIAGRPWWCSVLSVYHTWACFPSLQVVHGGVLFYMCIIHEHVSHHCRSSMVVLCSICASYMNMFPIITGRPRWCSVL